jgi:hypothetical protein
MVNADKLKTPGTVVVSCVHTHGRLSALAVVNKSLSSWHDMCSVVQLRDGHEMENVFVLRATVNRPMAMKFAEAKDDDSDGEGDGVEDRALDARPFALVLA